MSFDDLNIGHKIEPGMSIDNQLAVCGLDWQIDAAPQQSEFQGRMIKEDDVIVLRRGDTGERLATVGTNWTPYGNRRFLSDFNDFCDRAGFLVKRAGFLTRGKGLNKEAMSFASAVIPGSHDGELELDDGDVSNMRIIFLNYFTYGKAIGGFVMNERLFCQNQLVLKAVGQKSKRTLRHTANNLEGASGILKVKQTLDSIHSSIRDFWHVSECLTREYLTPQQAIDFFIKNYGHKEKSIEEQPIAVKTMIDIYFNNLEAQDVDLAMDISTTKDTAYGVLNAVTAYETHFQGYNPVTGRVNPVADSTRFLRSISSGSKAQLAYDLLSRKYTSLRQRQRQEQAQTVRAF